MTSSTQQGLRGPQNELHRAALHGSLAHTIALLSTESINIDQCDPEDMTPLMYAAQEGFSRVARVLLERGANPSIAAAEDGYTAMHISARNGNLAVTTNLVEAGADLEARTSDGVTPLYLALYYDNTEVMAALIEAGADVDSRSPDGTTPLFVAASAGSLDAVKNLLRANANPLLSRDVSPGVTGLPLGAAAEGGHSKVVCELIQEFGIKGCAGPSGGVNALRSAAETGHVDIMVILTRAGVADTGLALVSAAGWGGEAAVKFLLQQRQLAGSPTGLGGYVHSHDRFGATPLFRSINFCENGSGELVSISPRVVRLLVDAGADTSVLRLKSAGVCQNITPLAYVTQHLREKNVRGVDLTEAQLCSLEAVRRLLLRVEAVHAASWLWRSDVPSIAHTNKTVRVSSAGSAQLGLMLPILRRRRRGQLLAPLFR